MSETILGILAENVDPAAALIEDGRIVAVGEQERFSRNKHAYGEFPIDAVEHCLDRGDASLADLDAVAYGWDARKYPLFMAKKYLDGWAEFDKDDRTLEWEKENLEERRPERVRREIEAELTDRFDADPPAIEFYNHHESHAASAFYCSGFDSAAVLTVDGHGEENALVGWHATSDGIEQVFSKEIPHSLGWFYAAITAYLGFRPNNGEGKVMGLAPYGTRSEEVEAVLRRVVDVSSDDYELDPSYLYYGDHSHHERFTDELVDELGEPREHGEEFTERHESVAYETQRLTEEALEACARRLLDATGAENLCLAGGVAYNCKANMHLRESLDLSGFFVQPLSGESGVPIGSGLLAGDSTPPNRRLEHVYYGWEPTETRVETAVVDADVTVVETGRSAVRDRIVSELLNGRVVARYDGATESGPRALGNRSILADPRDEETLDEVNRVKQRANWRPFAPTILEEHADEVLRGDPSGAAFMIETFWVRDEWRDRIEAAVHVDGSTRPQIVSADANEGYWKLVDAFRRETGVPALLNTSFNLSGEPIVNTPKQAIDTLQRSEIDFLQVGPYLVRE